MSTNQRAVVVLLGCFNPPTIAHLRLLLEAKTHVERVAGFEVAEVVMSPVSDAYAKPTLISSEHRLAMSQLGVDELNAWPGHSRSPALFRLSRKEALLPTFSNSNLVMDWVLAEAEELHGEGLASFLLCGGDLFASLTRPDLWPPKIVKSLLSGHRLLVMPRPMASAYGYQIGDVPSLEHIARTDPSLAPYQHRFHYISSTPLNISSTEVRSAIADSRPFQFLVPPSVASYIFAHQLYSSSSSSSTSTTSSSSSSASL